MKTRDPYSHIRADCSPEGALFSLAVPMCISALDVWDCACRDRAVHLCDTVGLLGSTAHESVGMLAPTVRISGILQPSFNALMVDSVCECKYAAITLARAKASEALMRGCLNRVTRCRA